MSGELIISLSEENLDAGPAEERATFGLLAIAANDRLLTEGVDMENHVVRHGPYVSGYPLAEWMIWNWWRIRWEVTRPSERNAARRWHFAHSLQTVGDGYVWPNITIHTDSLNAYLYSKPSSDTAAVLFRYLGANRREGVSVDSLESVVNGFIGEVLSRLDGDGLSKTNVHRLWNDLQSERSDEKITRYRKLEAQLGFEPDKADDEMLRSRLDDASILGDQAVGELASDTMLGSDPLNSMMSARDISELAARRGFDADWDSAIGLSDSQSLPRPGEVEAWRLGKDVAQRVRRQEGLDGRAISNERLAELAGTSPDVISSRRRCSPNMSFVLREDNEYAHVSLRSSLRTGRRFELSRLVGDRMITAQSNQSNENLFPAILRSYSYRQKMQRAFAAEFLSPIAALDDILSGDYSEERQNQAARHFSVSPMTVQSQLVNNNRIFIEDAPNIYGRGGTALA